MRHLRVSFPSGVTFFVTGSLRALTIEGGRIVDLSKGETLLLDPRAVVTDETGAVLVNPRECEAETLPPWVHEWLMEHPEWPHIVTEAIP